MWKIQLEAQLPSMGGVVFNIIEFIFWHVNNSFDLCKNVGL